MQIHAIPHLQIPVWVYTQTIKQKVYTGIVKNDPHKFCHLNQPFNSSTLKIQQKHLFSWGKTEKLEIAVFTIYSLLFIYASKMRMKRQCQQTVLLKIIMYMIITHMSLGLKFLLCLNEKYFNFKKNHSDIMDFQSQQKHSCVTVGTDVSITRMGTGRSAYIHYNSQL